MTKKKLPQKTTMSVQEFLDSPVQDTVWRDVIVDFAVGMAEEKRPVGFDSDFTWYPRGGTWYAGSR